MNCFSNKYLKLPFQLFIIIVFLIDLVGCDNKKSNRSFRKDTVQVFNKIFFKGTPKQYAYTGKIINSLPNGHGELIKPNGDRYEGNFLNGKFDGNGSYFYKNGVTSSGYYTKYVGFWLNNQKSGQGSEVDLFASTYIFLGTFKNDLKNGFGTYHWWDGSKFESNYIDGNLDGTAVTYNSKGKVVGYWQYDHGIKIEFTSVRSERNCCFPIEQLSRVNDKREKFLAAIQDSVKAFYLYSNLKKVGLTETNLGTQNQFAGMTHDRISASKFYENLKKAGLSENVILLGFDPLSFSDSNSESIHFRSYAQADSIIKGYRFRYIDSVNTAKSSWISSARYYSNDWVSGFLIFTTGKRKYVHQDVPINVWQRFKNAESFGSYYDSNIRGRYRLSIDE